MEKTDETLLRRLRHGPANADWREFFDLYSFAMLCYAQKLGLSLVEAEDAVQETMITLMRTLTRFDYDPQRGRFRNYVITILHRRCLYVLRKRPHQDVSLDGTGLSEASAEVHLAQEQPMDDAWKASLVASAWQNLCQTGVFEEKTIAVFEAVCFEDQPADEVAKRYQLTPNAVYQIKHRVLRRLSTEVERLMHDLE